MQTTDTAVAFTGQRTDGVLCGQAFHQLLGVELPLHQTSVIDLQVLLVHVSLGVHGLSVAHRHAFVEHDRTRRYGIVDLGFHTHPLSQTHRVKDRVFIALVNDGNEVRTVADALKKQVTDSPELFFSERRLVTFEASIAVLE
ncbi:hypothetical protein D3C81_1716310 [compost metagenome]